MGRATLQPLGGGDLVFSAPLGGLSTAGKRWRDITMGDGVISPREPAAAGLTRRLLVRLVGQCAPAVGRRGDITVGDGVISPRGSTAADLTRRLLVRLRGWHERGHGQGRDITVGDDVISPRASAADVQPWVYGSSGKSARRC